MSATTSVGQSPEGHRSLRRRARPINHHKTQRAIDSNPNANGARAERDPENRTNQPPNADRLPSGPNYPFWSPCHPIRTLNYSFRFYRYSLGRGSRTVRPMSAQANQCQGTWIRDGEVQRTGAVTKARGGLPRLSRTGSTTWRRNRRTLQHTHDV